MFKIIGADGREYGPVSEEQLRQWIAEGRANAKTKVQAEGSTDWKLIGDLPGFAAAIGAGGGLAVSALPATGPVDAEALAAAIVARGYEIDIGSCITRGWELVKKNFWLVVGTSTLILLLLGGVGGLLRAAVNIALGVPLHARGLQGLRMQWPGILANMAWNLVVGGALLGGLCNFFLKLIRNQPANLADAFSGFSLAYGQLTLAYIVRVVLTYVGLALCLLPGIYLSVAWRFTLALVIDKRLGFWEAMELSRKVVTRQWWMLFALALVAGLISAAGVLACCIGLFVTAPIGIAASLYAYEDIFGQHAAQTA